MYAIVYNINLRPLIFNFYLHKMSVTDIEFENVLADINHISAEEPYIHDLSFLLQFVYYNALGCSPVAFRKIIGLLKSGTKSQLDMLGNEFQIAVNASEVTLTSEQLTLKEQNTEYMFYIYRSYCLKATQQILLSC